MQSFDWAAISAIASVVGGFGVVLSIVFLIYEVRRNAHAIEGASVQSLMSLEREVFSLLAENAALMAKGGGDLASLSETELYRYERAVGTYMSLVYSAFIQNRRDLVDDEVWDAYVRALGRHMDAPGFTAAWHRIKTGYPVSFQHRIDTGFGGAAATEV